jgi:hypothetical protein
MPDDDRELVPADCGKRDAIARRVRRRLSAVVLALALAGAVQAQTPPPFTCPRVVAWDANAEPDVAGYVVAWGKGMRAYSRSVTVDAASTSLTVWVPHGKTYIGALALNAEGHASEFGGEVVVTCDAGVERPPNRVVTLTGYVLRNVALF